MTRNNHFMALQHTVPGRVRLRVPLIRRDPAAGEQLAQMLDATAGIRRTRLNLRCASIIVRFDPGTITRQAVTRSIADFHQHLQAGKPTTEKQTALQRIDNHPDSGMGSALRRFIDLSTLAAGVFLRWLVLRLPIAQTVFSPLGVITALAALPLVKAGLSDLRHRRISLESFLGGGIVAAVAAGEALAALEILQRCSRRLPPHSEL